MDKVQIYYTVILAIGFMGTLYTVADGKITTSGPVDKALTYMLSIALALPVIGRIYGWW